MGMNACKTPDAQGFVPMPDGALIRWRRFGREGPAVALLHGNEEDYRCFARMVGPLSRRFSVVAVDSRGHGESTRGQGVTLGRMSDDLARVLAALGVERTHLVGFSDGANVALHFALDHPEQLGRLVLMGGNLCPAGVKFLSQLPCEVGAWLCRRLAPVSAQARRNGEILELMTKEPSFTPEQLGAIRAPTLVLAGDRDMIRPEHTALIAASIPKAQLLTPPNCSHFLLRDQPELTNRPVLRFLEA